MRLLCLVVGLFWQCLAGGRQFQTSNAASELVEAPSFRSARSTGIIAPIPLKREPSCNQMFMRNLHFSAIAKNMSRGISRMLCYFVYGRTYPDADFLQKLMAERRISVECRKKLKELPSLARAEDQTHFAVVRNPIDRFISSFLYACEDLTYKKSSLRSIHDVAKSVYHLLSKYRTIGGTRDDVRHHFAPQAWYCDIGQHPEKYSFIRYSRDASDMAPMFRQLLSEANFSQREIDGALSTILNSRVVSEHAEPERRRLKLEIMCSPRTLQYITATYDVDYELFGFERPVYDPWRCWRQPLTPILKRCPYNRL